MPMDKTTTYGKTAEGKAGPHPAVPRPTVPRPTSPRSAGKGAPLTASDHAVTAGMSIHPLYKVIKEFCSDPLGALYLAEFLPERKKVAVKALRRGVSCQVDVHFAENQDTLRIVDTLTGTHGETLIVTEHPVGETLKKTMSRQGLVFVKPAVLIAVQILSTVKKLHQKGKFIGALHPGMLFMSKTLDNKLRIKSACFNPSVSTPFVNLEGYSPPELHDEGGVGGKSSDLWAVGAILYEMLFGSIPIQSPGRPGHISSTKPPGVPPATFDELFLSPGFVADSPALAAVLRKALNRNPKERYPSAETMQQALLDVLKNPAHPPVSRTSAPADSASDEEGRRASIPTVPSPPRSSLIIESTKAKSDFWDKVDEDDTRPIIPPEELAEMLSKKRRLGGVFLNRKKMFIGSAAAVTLAVVGALFIFKISIGTPGLKSAVQTSEQPTGPSKALEAALPAIEKSPTPDISGTGKTDESRSTEISGTKETNGLLLDNDKPAKSSSHRGKKKSGKADKTGPVDNLSSNPFFLKNNPFPSGE